jgi:hypothetical protein
MRMSSITRASLFLLAGFLLAASSAYAEIPQIINYQGRLTDPQNNPVEDGQYVIVFNIWNYEQGGALLWSDTAAIIVESGLFTYQLGSDNPLPHSLFTDSTRYLGIKVGEDNELFPRTKLTPSAYAYHALRADTAVAIAYQAINNEMVMDTSIGFEKLAANDGEPGQILGFTGNKATGYWSGVSLGSYILTHAPPGWNDMGSIVTLHDNTDRVGIGTVLPEAQLHVYDRYEDPMHVSIYDADLADYDTRLVVDINGRVGVGTTTPVSPLGIFSENNWNWDQGNGWGDFSIGNGTYGLCIGVATYGGGAGDVRFWPKGGTEVMKFGNPTHGDAMVIRQNGSVGIGSMNPGDYKLYVESSAGGVNATSAFVKNTNTTDGIGMKIQNSSDDLTLVVQQLGDHPDGEILRCDSYTGGWHSVFTVKNSGRAICGELELTGGSDLAEPFEITNGKTLPEGALVVIDELNPGKLTLSDRPYDTRVAGVISGAGGLNPGLTLNQKSIFEPGQNVAIGGRVYCLADASYGSIMPGDMLTTSPTPGHAMKAVDRARAYGAVIGKAMTGLEEGQGLLLVLVSLQ